MKTYRNMYQLKFQKSAGCLIKKEVILSRETFEPYLNEVNTQCSGTTKPLWNVISLNSGIETAFFDQSFFTHGNN